MKVFRGGFDLTGLGWVSPRTLKRVPKSKPLRGVSAMLPYAYRSGGGMFDNVGGSPVRRVSRGSGKGALVLILSISNY